MGDKLCFVIGPMRDLGRLKRLSENIISPLVSPLGYTVQTPERADVGNIMDQVIDSLDRADLVVADLTGSNPNVFYELAIRHSIGRAYVTVKEETGDPNEDRTPFDIAA